MNKTLLIFPDNSFLADFVLQQNVLDIEVNTKASSLLGVLTEEQIEIACTRYNATQILIGQSPDFPAFPRARLK